MTLQRSPLSPPSTTADHAGAKDSGLNRYITVTLPLHAGAEDSALNHAAATLLCTLVLSEAEGGAAYAALRLQPDSKLQVPPLTLRAPACR